MKELVEIFISSIVLSIAFTIAFFSFSPDIEFIANIVKVLAFVVPSFILHELAHKYSALYFGAKARFFLYPFGLLLALVSSFFGFILAMPGAVYIITKLNKKQYGFVASVGPVVNILLSVLSFALAFLVEIKIGEYNAFLLASYINAFLAFFNLIPFPPLDGSKVFSWSKELWFVLILISFFLLVII